MRNVLFAGCLIFSLVNARAGQADGVAAVAMREHPIPGLALEIVQHGQVVKRAGYGFAELEWQIPVTPETVFEIGSVSKQFTAAGIMLLAQDGKLSVDDPISKYLKDTPEAWKDITIRHLLTHTSGIPNYTEMSGFEYSRHLSQAQFIQKIGAEPLRFAPGAKWSYCNSAFNLLGFIIENVSGRNYWDYMRARIFLPAGMTNTTSRDPRALVPHRAHGYETNSAGQFVNRDYELTDIFSAGAIVSTVDDIAKWSAALDAHQILTADTEAAMWTPVKLADGSSHAYGFGWFLDPLHGHKNIGHSGTTDGFSASFQRFPDDQLLVIVLCNSDESGIATKIAKHLAGLYLEPKPSSQ